MSKRPSTLMTQEETKSLLKIAQTSKVVNPFTCALTPPFIGGRRDFYILTIPLNSKNIPSVNTHTNVFYIYFLRQQLWLCFLLVRESPRSRNLHAPWLPNSPSIIFPNFIDSRSSWLRRFMALSLHEFATSRLRRFKILSHRAFATPRLREFGTPDHRAFATPRLRESQTPDLREFFAPENLHHKFH
jgi:hypothetical protein